MLVERGLLVKTGCEWEDETNQVDGEIKIF
jgi:hypothetical protein